MLLLGLSLPLILFCWESAKAQPMQLAPRGVESAALVQEAPAMPASLDAAPVAIAAVAPASAPAARRERYNVVVLGDSLGDGTWAGLYHVLRQDKRFNVIKKSRVATGFSRADYFDWNAEVRSIAAETRIDIAVVVMGTNDRQPIVEEGKRHALFEPGWRDIYERRVDDFTATLKATGAQIYWMELPVMKSPRFGADMAQFNAIFEARAGANNVTFVRTEGLATGTDGGYTAYGPDRFGRTKLLRAEDGIHFTMPGYELLGERIANAMLTDFDGGRIAAAAPVMPSAPEAPQEAAGKAAGYDMADRRPGRSDDWLWLDATN
ncbi:DUF459 domain-containing protein [Parvibaculum sp.]|uniref:SGNH/GDSL hydrolase family protein n=1 Tax=Parvibaculum sp. TaxID=2024848 RepID=UPI00391B8E27